MKSTPGAPDPFPNLPGTTIPTGPGEARPGQVREAGVNRSPGGRDGPGGPPGGVQVAPAGVPLQAGGEPGEVGPADRPEDLNQGPRLGCQARGSSALPSRAVNRKRLPRSGSFSSPIRSTSSLSQSLGPGPITRNEPRMCPSVVTRGTPR